MSLARRFLTGFRETETNQPGLELNEDGTVDLVNPDGSRTALPGGGSNPFDGSDKWASYQGDPTTVDSNADLPFTNLSDGAGDLLDLTDPLAPVVVTTGIYALACYVDPPGGGDPGRAFIKMFIAANTIGYAHWNGFPMSVDFTAHLGASYTSYCPAGDTLIVQGGQNSGVDQTWVPHFFLQRLA